MKHRDYTIGFLNEMATIAQRMRDDTEIVNTIGRMIDIVLAAKAAKGRVFFAGVGGGAGTGSHAVNDFVKIAGVDAHCLTDNPSLVTALANDNGWASIFIEQMKVRNFGEHDVLFVFSVNGGKPDISSNLVDATDYAHEVGGKVIGVLGKGTGHVGMKGDAVCVVPIVSDNRVTPHSESWQLAINHLMVNAIATDSRWS